MLMIRRMIMMRINQQKKFPFVLCCLLIIINLAARATGGFQPFQTTTTTTTTTTTARETALHRFFLLNALQTRGIFTKSNTTFNNGIVPPYDDDYDDYIPYNTNQDNEYELFTWKLIKHVLATEKSNAIISPFAIRLLLTLLVEAADNRAPTQNELYQVLEIQNRTYEDLRKFYKQLLSSLKINNSYDLINLETHLFADTSIKPNRDYLQILEHNYDTMMETLDFQQADVCVERINTWCANATKGRLQQLVSKDNLKNSVLLMASATYYSGMWRRQFNHTYNGIFYNTVGGNSSTVTVQYMQQTDYFYYYDDSSTNIKFLRLPYKGKRFAMLILMPRTHFIAVEKLIDNLDENLIKHMKSLMMETKLKVTIPKFKFYFAKDFKQTLIDMGVKTIFNNNASLPNLDGGNGNLKVTAVLQKAGIDVNENGTEAFASTLFEINNKFGMNPIIEHFHADRPFVFLIEDETTSSIIFAGKVLQP